MNDHYARARALPTRTKHTLFAFMSAFAWADLELSTQEREFILHLGERIGVSARCVAKALEGPPEAEDVDPGKIPRAAVAIFMELMDEIVLADGVAHPEELIRLELLRELTR